MSDASDTLSRIVVSEASVTLSRIAVLETEVKNVVDELKEIRKEQKEQHYALINKIDKIVDRVSILERWRWMIFGGAIVVGYIIAHVKIERLF